MKVLADTSIWIDHFRKPQPALVHLLDNFRNRIAVEAGALQNQKSAHDRDEKQSAYSDRDPSDGLIPLHRRPKMPAPG